MRLPLTLLLVAALTSTARAQESWTVAATPLAAVAASGGDDLVRSFDQVRGVLRGPNGEMIVADGSSSEIRVFSRSGEHLRSFAGMGDGPREFRYLAWIDWCGGEEIVAYDEVRFRITRWSLMGDLVDEFLVEGPTPRSAARAVACGRDGEMVVIGWPDVTAVDGPGPYRGTVPVATVGDRGERGRLLARVPGSERLRTERNDRPHPFGRPTVMRAFSGSVYIGTADSVAFSVIPLEGEPRNIAFSSRDFSLTEERALRWIDSYLEAADAPEEQRATLRIDFLRSEWMPDSPPAYASFLIDDRGHIWVEPMRVAWDGSETTVDWLVLDREGQLVATCVLPLGLQVFSVTNSQLTGVLVDADTGVETPVALEIVRQ